MWNIKPFIRGEIGSSRDHYCSSPRRICECRFLVPRPASGRNMLAACRRTSPPQAPASCQLGSLSWVKARSAFAGGPCDTPLLRNVSGEGGWGVIDFRYFLRPTRVLQALAFCQSTRCKRGSLEPLRFPPFRGQLLTGVRPFRMARPAPETGVRLQWRTRAFLFSYQRP